MLYLCLILYISAIYVRPAEILAPLDNVPVVDIVAAVAAAVGGLALLLRPRRTSVIPTDIFIVGFWLAIVLSNLVRGWFGGAWLGFLNFLPVVFCYFLVRVAVHTPGQASGLVNLFVFLNIFLAVNGIVQYHTGVGLGGVEALTEEHRIRGTGIFNDPNDLGMTLVMAVACVLVRGFGPGIPNTSRLAATVFLIPLLVAIYYTNSRGAVVGLGAVLVSHSFRSIRKVPAAVASVMAVSALLLLGPSRTSALDASEGSAQGRVEAWAEGLQMLKAGPIFGVGYGRFTDYHHRVAHNSFVHAAAELGVVGAFCLVGVFYSFFRVSRAGQAITSGDVLAAEASEVARASSLSAIGALTCGLFLSRQYVVVPYLILAIGGTAATIAAKDARRVWRDWPVDSAIVMLLTVLGIVATWIAVRALGDW